MSCCYSHRGELCEKWYTDVNVTPWVSFSLQNQEKDEGRHRKGKRDMLRNKRKKQEKPREEKENNRVQLDEK